MDSRPWRAGGAMDAIADEKLNQAACLNHQQAKYRILFPMNLWNDCFGEFRTKSCENVLLEHVQKATAATVQQFSKGEVAVRMTCVLHILQDLQPAFSTEAERRVPQFGQVSCPILVRHPSGAGLEGSHSPSVDRKVPQI